MNAQSHALKLVFVFLLTVFSLSSASAQNYSYDAAGRLTGANYANGSSISYEYDANGNVTRIARNGVAAAQPPDGMIDTPTGDVTIDAGQSVDFTGTGADPDGALPLTYRWDFEGGATESTDEDPGSTTFSNAGTYTVEFHVTDATGLSDPIPDSVVVTVNAVPVPVPVPAPAPPPPKKKGGGSVLWLPAMLLLVAIGRRLRRFSAMPVLLLTALLTLPLHDADAQDWVVLDSGVDVTLNDIWGSASDDVFAVGAGGTILNFDGTDWTQMVSGTTEDLIAVHGYGPSDVYAVGTNLTLLHYDGVSWSPFAGPVEAVGDYSDVWTAGIGERLWVITFGRAWYWDGAAWSTQSFSNNFQAVFSPNASLTGIGGTAASVIVTSHSRAGNSSVDGGLFARFRHIGQYESEAVFAVSENDMFVVGRQSRRFQGDNVRTTSQWQSINIMDRPFDAWGTSSSNMYAVGIGINAPGGRISHYDGNATNTWTTEFERPLDVFRGIWGSGESDIFVVGDNGTILQYRDLPPPETAGNFPYSGKASPFVNAHTGELVLSDFDLRRGHAVPVEFERYYASSLRYETRVGGHLGRNWTHTYEWGIEIGATEVTVISNRGRHFTFELIGTDWELVAPLDKPYSLTEFGGEFAFADPGAEKIYRFSKAGNRLTGIDDRNGNRVRLDYVSGVLASAHDAQSNAIYFRYNAQTRLEAVYTDGASSSPQPRYEITFTYINGNLASVTDAGGRVTTYEYAVGREADGLLHAAHLPLSTERRWIYDDQGRVTATLLTDGGDFLYDYGILSTDVTHPDGVQSAIWHDDNGAKTRHADGIGNVDTWSYDQDGRVATYTDRVGRTTSWLYEGGSFKVASVTRADGNAIEYSWEMHSSAGGFDFYDNTRIDYPDGTSVQFGHDNNGNVTSFTDQLANVWTYTHDGAGNVLTATDPGGVMTEYRYQADGALREITDSAGNRTFLLYDGYRRPTGTDFADQSRLLVTWNARGDVEQISTPAGDVIAYSYNEDGRQSRIVTADGGAVDFSYTAGGSLLERTVGNASTTSFTYDDYGRTRGVTNRLTAYLDEAGRTWAVDYDADGMPRAARMPNGDRIDFDNTQHALGLISSITAGNESVSMQYDLMNRLTGLTDALENVSGFVRDGRGLVTQANFAALQISTRYERNALGQLTTLVDANGNEWKSTYDANNRLASTIDPLGNETQYGFDNMNQVDRVTFPAGSGSVDISHGASGEVSREQYSDGTDIQIDTDIEGNVVGGTNLVIGYESNGNVDDSNGISIAYDSNDRISRITMAPNRFVDYEYNARGDLVRVTDWAGGVTGLVPDERGRMASVTRPDGISTSYAYDGAGRISGITFGTVGAISVQRNELGQITSATRNLPGLQTLESSEQTFAFNSASQVVGHDYDEQGNLRRDGDRSYQPDLAGRLGGYVGDSGNVSLAYDALGNRVSSQGPTGNRSYVHNYALSEARVGIEREDGQDLWYYVHTNDGRLLYRIDASGNRQHYHFDEMGNTVFMTDDAGTVIKSYFVGPRGEVLDSAGQVDNDITTAGEFGGWKMRDAENLVSLFGRYVNLNSLKPLTRLLQDSENSLEANPYRVDRPIHRDANIEIGRRSVKRVLKQWPGRQKFYRSVARQFQRLPVVMQLRMFAEMVANGKPPRRPVRRRRPPKTIERGDILWGIQGPKDAVRVMSILCFSALHEFWESTRRPIENTCMRDRRADSILKEVGANLVLP